MKKIEITDEIIRNIITDYNEHRIGSPSLSEKYKINKQKILQILKSNNCNVGPSGRKFTGGKSVSDKRYYEKNKDKIKEYYKNYFGENKDKISEYHKNWRGSNRDYSEYKKKYNKKLRSESPKFKLTSNFRTAIWESLRERGSKKTNRTFNLLGYTIEDLVSHLETLFQDGMSWDNYGDWHVDHIVPISNFNYISSDSKEFMECWSLSNLQPLWKRENLSKNNKIVAHQFKIRESKKTEQENKLEFSLNDVSLKNSEIRQIDRSVAKKIIEEYEWLGYMPRYCNYFFGIYFKIGENDYLGGVVTLQPEYGENMGVWDKYGYTNKIIQLSRGVCLWWTPKNTASYMISRVCEWLRKNTHYKVITATVDSNAGEIGTIYQSLNWYYVGTFGGNLTSTGKERIRYGYVINGKTYNQRHIRSKIGTAKKEEVLKHYPDVKIINMGRKKRYFYFIGNKQENKELLSSINNIIKSYPKR
jgi:hypothetical protein